MYNNVVLAVRHFSAWSSEKADFLLLENFFDSKIDWGESKNKASVTFQTY